MAVVLVAAALVTTGGAAASTATGPDRFGGDERFERSVLLSRSLHPDGADSVVIVSGEVPADSLAAGALAASLDAPLLLAAGNFLPDAVVAELERLDRPEVTIVGGTATITQDVERWLGSFDEDNEPRRIAGGDRFTTAALVSRAMPSTESDTVLIASGTSFPDALAASSAAARLGARVLLTASDVLPDASAAELRRLAPERVIIVGGPAAISVSVEESLRELAPDVIRSAGADRYSTAVEVSRQVGPSVAAVLAPGETPWNALLASQVAGRRGAVLLLARAGCLPETTAQRLRELDAETTVVGNEVDLSDDAANGHSCGSGERLHPLSAESREHLRRHGSATQRWRQDVITFWADPFFDSANVHRALEAWNAELAQYGLRFARAADRTTASIAFDIGERPGPESGVPQTACGSEGPSRYDGNRITQGHGTYYVHEDGCSRSTDWTVGIAHGIGHVLGLFEHSSTDDVMGTGRSGPLLPSLGAHQTQTLRWLYTHAVGSAPPP